MRRNQKVRVRRYLARRAIRRRMAYNMSTLIRLLFTSIFWMAVAILFRSAEAFGDHTKYAEFFRELTGFYSEQFSPLMLIFLGLALMLTFVFFGTFVSFRDSQELAREEAGRLFYTVVIASTSVLFLNNHPVWYFAAFVGQIVSLMVLACLINAPPAAWSRTIEDRRQSGLFKRPQ